MIKNNKIVDLQILYNMFSRRNESFEILRKHLSDYIITEGSKLVADDKLKNEDLVVKLIDLNRKITSYMHEAMQKDTRIDMTIKMAFEKVVNVNNRTAKALVFHLDDMFKREIRTI